ncbi:ribonuclease R, partial [Methylobacterium hispanicum]
MAKRATATPTPLPTREQILAFIAESKDKVGKREIAQAFGLKGADKIGLKRILKEIEGDGEISRSRGGLAKAGRLPPVVLCDIRSRDRHGDFVASPVEWTGEGKPPTIVLMP